MYKTLQVVGWIFIILGLVLGLMEARVPTLDEYGIAEEKFSFAVFITYFAACGFSGLVLLGLAEVINVLEKGNQTRLSLIKEIRGYMNKKEGA